MRILGVDPGSIVTGFGVIEYVGQKPVYITSGTIRLSGPLGVRLKTLFEDLSLVCTTYAPQIVVIEGLFSKINWNAVLTLAHARGVIMLVAQIHGCQIIELQPRSVKKAITGSGSASKKLVAYMVSQRLSIAQPMRADASDALALAMSYNEHIL